MAFALQSEIDVVNQTMDRISAAQITLADTTTVGHKAALRHFYQTRDSLFRSFEWPRLTTRAELYKIFTLTLSSAPTSAWAVGDTITGINNGYTAEILTVTSDTEYEIIRATGTFEDGETITNGTVSTVYWNGIELTYEGETVYWWDDSDAEQCVCNLTQTALTPTYKWTYQYYLPSDFVRLIDVYEDDGTDLADERWTLEGNRILTNYDTLNIKYIKSMADPDDWDSLFTEVFILRLALKLIPPLVGTKSAQLAAEVKEELKVAEAKARVIAAQENNTSGRYDLSLARYGS
ncbi:MAG: hypothetical protein M0R06_03355 [Sphaerochaeta sp.]|jgi:hypothetical protein|nr:hypothetical protein [Sphaerochaeta sp.]